ncbi:MAG: Na+/H+ antiporter NhaA [Ilumatobacteraceae bacterium]|nr:Na+/H+ antiporter NhaA [Ilumatobacteraceae bacterium]
MTRHHPRTNPSSAESPSPLRDFLRTEAAGGALLVAGAVFAMAWANSPWSSSYERLWTRTISLGLNTHTTDLVLRSCVNEGLITIFFFVVGLEIKRELTDGRLATRRAAFLPIVAAVGGMALPALIYLGIAGRAAPRGWAIVVATDIALAVGVVSIAGTRVPPGLRIFLLAVAIVDDIGALLIIGVAYSVGVGWGWLAGATAVLIAALVARQAGFRQLWPYLALGCLLWLMLRRAGLNPTLSGVAMGLVVPVSQAPGSSSVVVRLEHLLHPWASYVIVPLFALANSGITLSTNLIHTAIRSPITWAIVAGRVIGKPFGIVLATKSMIGARLADQPSDSTNRQLLGVATSAGMGFTVALFITELAFTDHAQRSNATLGILIAAVLAATLSLTTLKPCQDHSTPI